MIATAMIGYYLFAFGLLATVGYLAGRKNLRELRAVVGSATVEPHGTAAPPREPGFAGASDTAVPLCFYVTIRKHPEGGELLHELAVALVRGIDQYERGELGGAGVHVNADGTAETGTDLFLSVSFNASGRNDQERIVSIMKVMNRLEEEARTEVIAAQDADLRTRIAAKLNGPIPRAVATLERPIPGRLMTSSSSA